MIWKKEESGAEPEPEAPPRRQREEKKMAQEAEVTVVGQGARLEGTIVSAGSLRVDGQVKGQINADGDVMLSPQSQVDADIKAENVTIAGRFKGNINVKGKVELNRGGRIDGNLTSKVLVIQEGGIFCGQSQMDQQAQAQQQAAPASQSQAAAQPAQPAESGGGGDRKAEGAAEKARVH